MAPCIFISTTSTGIAAFRSASRSARSASYTFFSVVPAGCAKALMLSAIVCPSRSHSRRHSICAILPCPAGFRLASFR